MKQTIDENTFIGAFNREGRGDYYSYEALVTLYKHYEAVETTGADEIELNVEYICMLWTEYDSIEEYIEKNDKKTVTLEQLARGNYILAEIENSKGFLIMDC